VIVPLNDKEQRILDEIERQFLQDDPKLAKAVRTASATDVFRRSARRTAAGFVLGLAVMLIFFTTSLPIAMIGFVIMVASASVFVVSIRRRTMGPGAGGFGPDSWIDRLRSKWQR
jgi:DNA-binding Lrp family transcriptional regulator